MRQLKITQQLTDRSDKSFERYLTEIARISILITAQEEVDLAVIIANNENPREVEKAIEKLVTANLRFVVSVAKQYQNQGMSLPDLINEGNVGLVKAAERFDHTKGFKFISYAVWWVRQSILQALAENSRQIRLPLNKISAI
jgi:RNA polymerase primary sigma factor